MKRISKVATIFAIALMLSVLAVGVVLAQDTTKGNPPKVIADSVKAKMQENSPAAASEAAMEEADNAAEAGTEAMDEAGKAVEAGTEAMEEDMTPSATDEKMKDESMDEEPAKVSKPYETGTTDVNPKAPYMNVEFKEGDKPIVVMETSMGVMTIELWPDVAPKHCQSFVHLINEGFYDSLTFHRVVPGFVIQGGCPLGNGTGGPGYNVPAEFSNKAHEDGILSMARSSSPNSAGSQFFVCLGRLANLDNSYTVFGKVIDGLDIAHKIEKVPTQGERPKEPVVMTKVYVKAAE